jgi:hypothetical protein
MSSITLKGNLLAVATPYAPDLVAALKTAVPGTDRKWDGASKLWLVDPVHGPVVQKLIREHLGENCTLPSAVFTPQAPTMRLLELRYLGRAKTREDNTASAYGWVDGGWNAIFPKAALLAWFGQQDRPGEAATLYQVLGVKADADGAAIKAAWKRLAKQWHPDQCREPDAAGQFRAIKEAYEVLADDNKRGRYDAGRALEATLKGPAVQEAIGDTSIAYVAQEWASPLRCGYVLANGISKLGRFVVSDILAWEDIVRGDGCTLVASWPMGAEHFTEAWV